MQESLALVETLKKILRSKGITYHNLSEALNISEASVKRVFSEANFSLERFEKICQFAGVSITEVADLTNADRAITSHIYTLEQEKYFAENPKYLAFFDLLLRFGSLDKVRKYKPELTDQRVSKYLKQLESMNLIQRHPNDRVTFPVSRAVSWQRKGPLGKKFRALAKSDFLNHDFSKEISTFAFFGLELTPKSAQQMAEKLKELAIEAKQTSELEQKVKAKTEHFGVMVAQRPWRLSLLEDC